MPLILRGNGLANGANGRKSCGEFEIAVDNQSRLIRMADSWRGVEQLGSSSGS